MAIDVVKKPWQIVEFERLVGGADELAIKNTIANIFSTYDDWNYQEKSHWGFTIAQLRLAAEIAEDDAYKDLSLKEVNSELLRAIFSKNIELSIRKQIAAYLKPGIDGYYQRVSNQEPVGDGYQFAVNRAALMALCLVCDFELLPPEKRLVPGYNEEMKDFSGIFQFAKKASLNFSRNSVATSNPKPKDDFTKKRDFKVNVPEDLQGETSRPILFLGFLAFTGRHDEMNSLLNKTLRQILNEDVLGFEELIRAGDKDLMDSWEEYLEDLTDDCILDEEKNTLQSISQKHDLLNNKENGANYQSVADVALTNAEPESDFRKPSKTKELNTDANLNPILPSDSKNNAVTNNPIIRPSQWLSRNNLSDAAEFVLEKVRNNKVARKAMVEVFQHPYFTALSLCALKFFKMEGSEVNEENVAEFMINLCEKGHENISKLQGGNDLKYCSTVNNELLVLGFMKDDSLMNAFYTQSKELSGAIGFSNKGLKFGAAALSHMGGQEFGEDALNGLLRNIESDELAAARLNIEVGLRKERAKLFEDKKSKVVTSWADDKVTELAKIKSGGDQILQRIFDSRQDKGVVLGKNSLMVSSVMVVTGKKCSDWKEKMSQPSQLTDLTWITSLLGSLRADYDDDKKAQAKEDIMKELYTSAHAIQTKHRFAISNPKTHEDLSVLQDLAAIFLVFDHKQDASLVRLFNPNFKNEDHDESENASKQIYETIEKKINDLRVNLDISPAPAVANSSGGVRFSNAYSSNNRNH